MTTEQTADVTTKTVAAGTVSRELDLVVVRVAAGHKQTIDDARGLLDAVASLVGDRRVPILVDLRRAEPLDADVRHVFSGSAVDRHSALALLVEGSPFGRLLGSFYLRVARLGTPARIFADEAAARAWLTR